MSDAAQSLVVKLVQEGALGEALSMLEQLFVKAELATSPTRTDVFMTMFQLSLLKDKHAPARAALRNIRDTQAARLLARDIHVGLDSDPPVEEFRRIRRFSLIAEINEMLDDHVSTCEVFARLDSDRPELARRYAWTALPALVADGRFALADRYRDDPLKSLEMVNQAAPTLPLYPGPGEAPRLAADLTNLVRDVRIGMAVLRGLGHDERAGALHEALLAGLASDELRDWARREIDAPGAITRGLVERQMEREKDAR